MFLSPLGPRKMGSCSALHIVQLRCVMQQARKALHLSTAHSFGFRRRCCPELITESLRQASLLSCMWNKPVYIISADVDTAFGDMRHADIFESLLKRGVHPTIANAIVLEYVDLGVRAKVADADPSDFFPFLKSWRQGGVETPELESLRQPSRVQWPSGLGSTSVLVWIGSIS